MGASKKQQRVLTDAGTHVWLRHTETGNTWAAPLDAAQTFIDHLGWEYADAPDTSLDGLFDTATPEGAEQTGFDPAEHDVPTVNAHLAKYAETSPGEVERVLELERAGQNRKTVVDPRPPEDDPNDPDGDGADGTGD